METLLQQIVNGLVSGSVYVLVALGYTMVYGILGLINFAHGDVLMVGSLIALQTIIFVGTAFPGLHPLAALGIGLVVAVPMCMLLGYTIERAYVMENGAVTVSGTGRQLLHDPKVRQAYLGDMAEAA
jgi:branched-chain amino acid transport system permease protein